MNTVECCFWIELQMPCALLHSIFWIVIFWFLVPLLKDGEALPNGPVVISPDGLFPSLYREGNVFLNLKYPECNEI